MKNVLVLAILLLSSTVYAGRPLEKTDVIITANVFIYESKAETTPGGASESKVTIYDFKGGYLIDRGWYLGAIYTMRSSQNGSGDESGTALGASGGYYFQNGFYLAGHYIFDAKLGDFKEGSGFQVDFGYITSVSGSLYVGVELTHRSITYKSNDTAVIDKHTVTEMMPMLTVGIRF